jgi:hypothetical protein
VSLNVVQLRQALGGGYYLLLVSPNGERLAHSENYRTHWNAKRAARKNFAGCKLLDLTRPEH